MYALLLITLLLLWLFVRLHGQRLRREQSDHIRKEIDQVFADADVDFKRKCDEVFDKAFAEALIRHEPPHG